MGQSQSRSQSGQQVEASASALSSSTTTPSLIPSPNGNSLPSTPPSSPTTPAASRRPWSTYLPKRSSTNRSLPDVQDVRRPISVVSNQEISTQASGQTASAGAARNSKQRKFRSLFTKRNSMAPTGNVNEPAGPYQPRDAKRQPPVLETVNPKALEPSKPSVGQSLAGTSTPGSPDIGGSISAAGAPLDAQPSMASGSSAQRRSGLPLTAFPRRSPAQASQRRKVAMLSGNHDHPSTLSPTRFSSGTPPLSLPTSTSPSSPGPAALSFPIEEDPAVLAAQGALDPNEIQQRIVSDLEVPDPADLAEAAESKRPAPETPTLGRSPTISPSEARSTSRAEMPELVNTLRNAVDNEPADSDLPTEIWNRILEVLNRDVNRRAPDSTAARPNASRTPAFPPFPMPASSTPTPTIPSTGSAPTTLPPPLPVIPAGTTMIIQGIVQAADEPRENTGSGGTSQTPSTSPTSPTFDATPPVPASPASPTDTTPVESSASPTNASRLLSGTPTTDEVPSAGAGPRPGEGASSAAELLGALLTAAASATANMLLTDPQNTAAQSLAANSRVVPAPASPASLPPPYSSPVSAPAIPMTTSTPVNADPTHSASTRSSVGVGPRPQPSSLHLPGPSGVVPPRERSRPRSLIGGIRDRLIGNLLNGSSLGVPPVENPVAEEQAPRPAIETPRPESYNVENSTSDSGTPTTGRDPIETLRERIASELMRALSARDPNGNSDPPTPITPRSPMTPTNADGSFGFLGSLGGANNLSMTGASAPEGSFQRFLHDTNIDLRATLNERANARRENRAPVPVPISTAPEAPGSSTPEVPETTASDGAPTPASPLAADTPPSPIRLVNRPAEGVIEPRLNWWRMHRFPSRVVAAPSSNGSSSGSGTPASSAAMSPSTTTATTSTAATADSVHTPSTTNPPNSMTLVPVIVVGVRTAPSILVQDIAAMTTPPPGAPTTPAQRNSAFASVPSSPVTSLPPPTPSTPSAIPTSPAATESTSTFPSGNNDVPDTRRWSGRAVDVLGRAIARRRMERERERDSIRQRIADLEARIGRLGRAVNGLAAEVESATGVPNTISPTNDGPNTRNYLIWVIGGYYPETHPILVSPNLLLNHFDQDDFWGLADLLGQVKPPVASKDDIERAGLQIIRSDVLKKYEEEGKVTSNTTERCLICLSDYEDEEDLRLMSCKHVFHKECVDKWLEIGRNNCPACRAQGVEVGDRAPTVSSG